MNFETYLALKYIKSTKGKEKFISFSSFISMAGIAIGVAALIIVMGVMNGFDNELEKKIVDVNPHIVIKNVRGVFDYNKALINKISHTKGIKTATGVLITQGMITGGGASMGVVINGIDVKQNPIKRYIIYGRLKNKGVILGYELSKILGIGVGGSVRIILPFGKTTPFGFAPLSFKETVTGLFKSGMYDYDASFVYIPLEEIWSKTDLKNKINTIAVELKDPFKAKQIAEELTARLPANFYASSWIELNSNFFTALKLEKAAMFIILMLIIIVASFNITSSLVMLVLQKTRDIAVLRSLGATGRNIRNIFIKQSAIIGTIGIIAGDILGITLSILLKKYHFIKLPSSVYYITTIPVDLNPIYIVFTTLLAFILVIASSIYPATKASKLNIIEVLRQ